jgi:glycyl-tRNA synthetase
VPDEERAFYSKGTYDIEYDFPFGRQELEGVAYRTDYDLSQHQKASGKSLEYFDEETKERFVPHVVEPSAGVDRTVLALICEAYSEDQAPNEKGEMESRVVLRFHPRIAPVKCGVFPLLRNNPQLVAKAKEVVDLLRPHMTVFYDESGAIGRRYRRQDEIGTPFGITIDFETLGEKDSALRDTVTLRDRDSMKQERVAIQDLPAILRERLA